MPRVKSAQLTIEYGELAAGSHIPVIASLREAIPNISGDCFATNARSDKERDHEVEVPPCERGANALTPNPSPDYGRGE